MGGAPGECGSGLNKLFNPDPTDNTPRCAWSTKKYAELRLSNKKKAELCVIQQIIRRESLLNLVK